MMLAQICPPHLFELLKMELINFNWSELIIDPKMIQQMSLILEKLPVARPIVVAISVQMKAQQLARGNNPGNTKSLGCSSHFNSKPKKIQLFRCDH